MKSKIIIAAITLFTFTQVQSQVTFKPGLRAGVNFSHFTQGDDFENEYTGYDQGFDPQIIQYRSKVEFSNKTDFYVGFYGALRLTKYYTLQPEINYSRQGSNVQYTTRNLTNNTTTRSEEKFDVSYLSISIINKFTFSEKFNMHIGPTIDFVVDKSRSIPDNINNNYPFGGYDPYYSYYEDNSVTDVDLAFYAGFGYNFTKNIGLEARVKKGIIPVIDTYDSDHTNVVFSLGATYTFDLK